MGLKITLAKKAKENRMIINAARVLWVDLLEDDNEVEAIRFNMDSGSVDFNGSGEIYSDGLQYLHDTYWRTKCNRGCF